MKPDSEIARGILGQRSRVWVRESDIDDVGRLELTGVYEKSSRRFGASSQKSYPEIGMSKDTGWFEITNDLVVGNNHLFFWVHNIGGPCSGRFQLSVGSQQYDTGPVHIEACRDNSNSIGIYIGIGVSADGSIQILEEMPQFQ